MDAQVVECPRCVELMRRIEVLERKLGRVLRKFSEAEERIRKLQEQLAGSKKDSGNSSKPPSSDISDAADELQLLVGDQIEVRVAHDVRLTPAITPGDGTQWFFLTHP